MDRSTKSAGQRPHRTAVRDSAGPPREGNASSGDRYHRSGESLFRNTFSSGVGAAFYGAPTSSPRCASTAGARTSSARNPERARHAPGRRRSHRELGGKPLGGAPGRSLRGASWGTRGNRADQRTKPSNTIKPKYHAPADHPWRKPWKRTILSGTKP